MSIEAMKLALFALDIVKIHYTQNRHVNEAIAALKERLAQRTEQEPDYWLGYGLQAHTEKPFENATALYKEPPQRTEQNFCSRCGKRTKDIHTCTPPQENT